jgi:hypothetical protein
LAWLPQLRPNLAFQPASLTTPSALWLYPPPRAAPRQEERADTMIPNFPPSPKIDSSVPDPARRYNYWLGGKDNFAVDRDSGNQIAARFPSIRVAAQENRRFMARAVRALAEAGIDQFLDIGTGLPTDPNLHDVAHAVNPDARVVYVDNSTLVLVHARALLTAGLGAAQPEYIDADLRQPNSILHDATLRKTLDFSRPVALMLIAVMHFFSDDDHPYSIVEELIAALPTGSYLALTHLTGDLLPQDVRDDFDAMNAEAGIAMRHRSLAEVNRFFTKLHLVEPGIVPINRWRAETEHPPRPIDTDTAVYGGLARVP